MRLERTLKNKGTAVGQVHYNDGSGLYAGTTYYYVYNDSLYSVDYPTNAFHYTGPIGAVTEEYRGVEKAIKEYSVNWWTDFVSQDIYDAIYDIYIKD